MANSASTVTPEAEHLHDEHLDVSEACVEQAPAERRKPVGRPRGSNKAHISLRIDKDVIERFKADGPGWQSRINDALRSAIGP